MKSTISAALFSLLVTAAVASDPMEYSLQQFCNQTIDTFSSALLNVNGEWWRGVQPCNVTIHADHETENQVRLEILDLHADCSTHWLTLYDGQGQNARPISPNLCDGNYDDKVDSMYLTISDRLTIVLHSNPNIVPADPYNFQVKLLATSTSIYSMDGNDFYCDNGMTVIIDLECDGYNNCGDWSDESNSLCGWDRLGWRAKAGIYGGVAALLLIKLVIIVCIVVRKRRQQQRQAALATSKANHQPPPYNSIQNGNTNKAYATTP